MSTRYYPLYVKGNPQLRVFLPNFWMKMVKPKYDVPPNEVHFIVSTEMTKLDVRNYLDKIYNVPTFDIRIKIKMGEFKRDPVQGYITKDSDFKIAYVTLPRDQKFPFPNLFPEEKKQESLKELNFDKEALAEHTARKEKNWQRPGIPLWFGV